MDGLDIAAPQTTGIPAGYRRLSPQRPPPSRLRRHARLFWFMLFVMLPTVISGVYFIGFAADQYVSEARFVVRGAAQQSPGMLSSLLQTAGVARAQDDTYAVQDFILSRDALGDLIADQGIRDVFARPEADRLSRYPHPWDEPSFESFYRYYQDHIAVSLDSTTGVTALTVKTFRGGDSQRIATALLAAAERLVNRMNARQRENAMSDARKEVGIAEARLQSIATQLAGFRNREALLDPNKQSVAMLQNVNELQTMLSRVNLQIAQLSVSSPRSPLIADYRRRAAALQAQIGEAGSKITGTDTSLVPKITEFDMLTLQREFADRQLASATTSLEAARMQAESQQLYLDLIVQPNLADYAAYPKGIASIAVVFASALGLFVMGGLLIAGAREHRIV